MKLFESSEQQFTCLIATAHLGQGSRETVPTPPWPSGETHVYVHIHTRQLIIGLLMI